MIVENISQSISTKECCRPRLGLNPRPPGLQSDGASNRATEAGISNQKDFSYCWYTSPWYFQWTLSQLPFGFRRKSSKQTFKMDAMAAIWDFLSQWFELFFIYKSSHCLLPSFEPIGFSVHQKKGKINFQDDHHLGFPIGTILAIFISTSHPAASYQFSNQLALWFRKISEKSFKMAAMVAILDFRSKQFKLF